MASCAITISLFFALHELQCAGCRVHVLEINAIIQRISPHLNTWTGIVSLKQFSLKPSFRLFINASCEYERECFARKMLFSSSKDILHYEWTISNGIYQNKW